MLDRVLIPAFRPKQTKRASDEQRDFMFTLCFSIAIRKEELASRITNFHMAGQVSHSSIVELSSEKSYLIANVRYSSGPPSINRWAINPFFHAVLLRGRFLSIGNFRISMRAAS